MLTSTTVPHITRASNGDLLIFGSNADLGFRPWAIRLTSTGEVRWEFLQGAADGWNDRKEKGQRFDSAVELSDQTTLLCGLQVVNYEMILCEFWLVVPALRLEFV